MSDDLASLINQTKNMLDKLRFGTPTRVSNQDQLREGLASYIVNQTLRIDQDDRFTEIAELELAERIMTHQVSNEELLEYIRLKKHGKAINTTALLDIFKPNNTSSNPLLNPPSGQDKEELLEQLKPEQRQAIAKLTDIMTKLTGDAIKNSVKSVKAEEKGEE